MLNKVKMMKGYKLHAQDGEIGQVKQFYFDDHYWTVRYLVADTGNWLTDRQVLISPYALISVNKKFDYISVALTKKQIEESPPLGSDKPVSEQFEAEYYGYFGWPLYWGGPLMWGTEQNIVRDRKMWQESTQREKSWDRHLRSTDYVTGHTIHATDGDIGHVDDFIIDDQTWAIRYLIVDTKDWWPGKKVLISPHWIERVSWSESKVIINLSRESIKQSTEYNEGVLLTRDYEIGLHQHYKRDVYWDGDSKSL